MEIGKLSATDRGRTTRFEVQSGQPATLGRSSRCTVRLADPKVSREHCRLLLEKGKLRVTDLDSSQGLRHRGQRLAEFEIEVGDGFHVGHTFVRFESCAIDATPVVPVVPVAPAEVGEQVRVEGRPTGAQGELAIGAAFGGFVIEAVIGRSDRGTVYRATQVALRRQVALKVLHHQPLSPGAPDRAMFLTDMRTAASIADPRLVQVLDVGEIDGLCYASLELVKGQSLAVGLGDGRRMPWQELVAVLADALQALDVLHSQGLVHGGVKPTNVFALDNGSGMLADNRSSPQRRSLESPCFSAPEQLAGKPVDVRADLYDLGCVAYAALAGEAPFQGSANDIREAQRQYCPASLRIEVPGIPPGLDDFLCTRLLAFDPAGRPRTAAEARSELLAGKNLAPPKANGPRSADAPGSRSLDAYAARPELRRRPVPQGKLLLARLVGQLIIFSIHVILVVIVLLALKYKGVFDLYETVLGQHPASESPK